MLEIRVEQSAYGQQFINTFNLTGADAVPLNVNAIADALVTVWANTVVSRLMPNWQINRVTYREYPSIPNAPFLTATTTTTPLVGTSTNPGPLASHTAMRINTLSSSTPPFSGSFFLGGWGGQQLSTDAEFGSGAIAAGVSFANELLNLGTTLGLDVSVGIRSRGTLSLPVDTTSVATQMQIIAAPSSLDSRRIGTGV